MRTRRNNEVKIIPFKFAGIINGYYITINGKKYIQKGMIQTFKTRNEAKKQIWLAEIWVDKNK